MAQGRANIYLDLREIVGLAGGVTLTNVNNLGSSSITVIGTASTPGAVYDYARALRSSPRFSGIWVSSVTGSAGAFSFQFTLTK